MGAWDKAYANGLLNVDAPTLSELAAAMEPMNKIGKCTNCVFVTRNKSHDWCQKCGSALLWKKITLRDRKKGIK